jgi:cytochrome c oxidase subunit 3
MTTTVHERQQPDSARYPAQADFGGHGNVTSESGSWRAVEDRSPASRTGIWVGLAAITMTFAAFTSAMVVRQGSSTDWRHFALPSVLYLNTAILLTSSVTLELARQRVRWLARGLQATSPSSSFFYLFTAIHAIHVLGGLAGLMVVVWRFSRPVPTLRLSTVSTVSYYWHFMDLLWVYLLFLLWTRI